MSKVSRSSLDQEHVKDQLRHLTGTDMAMLMFFAITKSHVRAADALGWFSDKQLEGRLRLLFPKLNIARADFMKYKKMRQELIEILHPFVNQYLGLPQPIPLSERDNLLKGRYSVCMDDLLAYFNVPVAKRLYSKGVKARVDYKAMDTDFDNGLDDYIAFSHVQQLLSINEERLNAVNLRVGNIKRRLMARKGHPLFKDERFTKIRSEADITLDLFEDYKVLIYLGIPPEKTEFYRFFVDVKGEKPEDVVKIFHLDKHIDSVEYLGEMLRNTNLVTTGSPFVEDDLGCSTLSNFMFNKAIYKTDGMNYIGLKIPKTQISATLWVDVFSVFDKGFLSYTRA